MAISRIAGFHPLFHREQQMSDESNAKSTGSKITGYLIGCGCLGILAGGVAVVAFVVAVSWSVPSIPDFVTADKVANHFGDSIRAIDAAIKEGRPLTHDQLQLPDEILEIYSQEYKKIKRNNSTRFDTAGQPTAVYKRFDTIMKSRNLGSEVGYGQLIVDGEKTDCIILRRDGAGENLVRYQVYFRDTLKGE